MNLLLENKVAVITGGARGIGAGIAKIFAEQGANIAILDICGSEASAFASGLEAFGVKAVGKDFDVCATDKIADTMQFVESALGPIDIWVNNAGISRNVSIEDLTEREWGTLMDVDLKSVVFCSKAVFASMKARRAGKIINIASLAGQRGGLYAGIHYSAAKSGVIVATKCFALYGASYGVNVNAIAPGLIETSISKDLGFDDKIDEIPMGRLGTPEDVGKVALFLASNLSDYVTGQTISVNGGMYMG